MYVHFVVCNADEGGLDISSNLLLLVENAWPVSQHVSLCTKLVIVILALCRTWFAHHKTLAWLVLHSRYNHESTRSKPTSQNGDIHSLSGDPGQPFLKLHASSLWTDLL